MADPRFFSVQGPFKLADIAEIGGAILGDGADPETLISDVRPLDSAGAEHITFLQNPRYLHQFEQTRAGACIVREEYADRGPERTALLLTNAPHKSYARIAQAFYPQARPRAGISPRAHVDDSAKIGEGSCILPGAIIGARAEIGRNCIIGANAVIGPGVVLGDDGWIGVGASLAYCIVGARVRILAGARIGEDGFGFAMDPDTPVNVPQIGRVIIGDDVEIGANSTIDRGSGPDTVVGDGCRIDNLVHIGHNVRIGRGCVLVGQCGIAGSTKLEDYVVLAAQSGVAGHLHLGKASRVAARSGVTRDVEAGQTMGGFPAVPFREWLRQTVMLQRLTSKQGR